MTIKILDSHLVAVIGRHEYGTNQLFRVFQSTRTRYYCDPQGNIYAYDLLAKKAPMKRMRIQRLQSARYVNPSVVISTSSVKRKRIQVKMMVAMAIFPNKKVTPSRVGHLDGNPKNNAISNIYLDLRPDPIDETIYPMN